MSESRLYGLSLRWAPLGRSLTPLVNACRQQPGAELKVEVAGGAVLVAKDAATSSDELFGCYTVYFDAGTDGPQLKTSTERGVVDVEPDAAGEFTRLVDTLPVVQAPAITLSTALASMRSAKQASKRS